MSLVGWTAPTMVAAVVRQMSLPMGERLPTLRACPGFHPGPPNLYDLVHTPSAIQQHK
jgi:hypothetical protein